MDNESDLLPCPFCGGNVTINVSENGKAGAFVCTSGSTCIGSGLLIGFIPKNRDSAIAAWNTRIRPAAPVGVNGMGEIERIVWDAMIWAYKNHRFVGATEYTDNGNSFAEEEARAAARRILAALAKLKGGATSD